MDAPPPDSCDVAVVGAGVVGLAVARELLSRHPRMRVCVLEREARVAAHQSGHNSGVVHAGIYYQPGSLKARLCVAGARELYDFCEAHGVPHERCGKLIVAVDGSQLARLDELERRGHANGVPGLRRVDAAAMAAIEPHVRGVAGLHSPNTGIVDFAAVARACAEDVRGAGGMVALGCGVTAVTAAPRALRLTHARGVLEAGHAIFCAGAWSDRLAVAAGAGADPRIVSFRGAYLRLAPHDGHLVRALVYPVGDPTLPFLGVHLTRHIGGDVLVGPTALLVGARDAYALTRVRPHDLADTLAWPGTWRMLARWWRAGAVEMAHALAPSTLMAGAARLVPELRHAQVQPAFAGVRAQALGRDGSLLDDFVFASTPRALHVRNAPSPAATSCLAIARHVVATADAAFALG